MMSTRSGRTRQSLVEVSPPRTRKGVSPTRSPARNQKSSPAGRSSQKSPSRKSPSRKSPSRKPAPKYPARKSPSRAVKETEEVKESTRSPSKRPTIKRDVEVILEDVSDKVELLRSTRARRIEYSVADYTTSLPRTDLPKVDLTSSEGLNGIEVLESRESRDDIFSTSLRNRRTAEETAPRRSSRLRDVVDSVSDTRRSLSKSLSKSISQSIASYSDEEDEMLSKEKSKSQSVTRKLATPLPSSTTSPLSNRFEFGGRICATTLYILIPLTVFYILISCSKACSYISLKQLTMHKNISLWFNTPATVLVIGNFLLQTILLSVPAFGTKEIDNKGRRYYFNAFFSSFCTLNILFGLDYYGVLGNDTVLNSYFQMATVSYIVAVILSLIMFLKSREVDENDLNPYGNSGYALYDFFIGRETQVVLLKTNVKLWLARVSNISTLILSILIFKHGFTIQEKEIVKDLSLDEFKNILNKVHIKPTILVYSMMQIIYALYFIMREKKVVSTFYWNSEGLGYMQIVSSALYPFYFTTISKYVADTDLQLTTNTLVAASALYLLGFLIMLISNNIKYEFRKNPLQPSLIHVDSMPTFHGKKLLLSNLWGVVRHPNYAGDILIHAALAIPGIQSRQVIAAAPALLTVATLLHRCWRDHGRCRRRYGAAWTRYCKRVPCVIVPTLI